MAEMQAGIGPVAKDKCDTLVLELTNESAFYDAMYLLMKGRHSKNKWVGKAPVTGLVRTTMKTVRTITKLSRITPAMMEYVYQALMREYQAEMDDMDKERMIFEKGADFLIVDDLMAEDLPLGTERKFIHGHVHNGPSGVTTGASASYRTTDNIPRHAGSFHNGEVFLASGGPLPTSWYDHVAKATGKDRNQVKADFYASMYGSKNTINPQQVKFNGEPKMNFNTKPFENVNYDLIFGCKAEDLSESQLFDAIKELEGEIKSLEKIETDSVAKDTAIQNKRDNIASIVKVLDARITKKETK